MYTTFSNKTHIKSLNENGQRVRCVIYNLTDNGPEREIKCQKETRYFI